MRKLSKQWGVVCILAVAVCLLMASAQVGAETIKVEGRNVTLVTKAEVLEIGDVPGHFIGIFEQAGLQTELTTGEAGSYTGRGMFDYTKGSGAHEGYDIITFEDGSTIIGRYQGTTRKDPEGQSSSFEGKWTYIGGTGRYAGIEGGGTYTGRRLAPMGAEAVVYSDWTGTRTLP